MTKLVYDDPKIHALFLAYQSALVYVRDADRDYEEARQALELAKAACHRIGTQQDDAEKLLKKCRAEFEDALK